MTIGLALIIGLISMAAMPVHAESVQNSNNKVKNRSIILYYDVARTESFMVGSTGVDATLFIHETSGGVKFDSTDYCDYYVIYGNAINNWGDSHYFDSERHQTTSCEFSARCYESSKPIVKVEVYAKIASSDDQYEYEQVGYIQQ